jgi:hypothetical protein
MFRCEHCKKEYGGIRGIAHNRCPRCTPDNVISIYRLDPLDAPRPPHAGYPGPAPGASMAIRPAMSHPAR